MGSGTIGANGAGVEKRLDNGTVARSEETVKAAGVLGFDTIRFSIRLSIVDGAGDNALRARLTVESRVVGAIGVVTRVENIFVVLRTSAVVVGADVAVDVEVDVDGTLVKSRL